MLQTYLVCSFWLNFPYMFDWLLDIKFIHHIKLINIFIHASYFSHIFDWFLVIFYRLKSYINMNQWIYFTHFNYFLYMSHCLLCIKFIYNDDSIFFTYMHLMFHTCLVGFFLFFFNINH